MLFALRVEAIVRREVLPGGELGAERDGRVKIVACRKRYKAHAPDD